MTVKELKEKLNEYPDDAIVSYYHNVYASIFIEEVYLHEDTTLTGTVSKTVVLAGAKED